MVKFPEADARLFRNKFVCRRCKCVVRSRTMTVLAGKTKCRKCQRRALRPKRKK